MVGASAGIFPEATITLCEGALWKRPGGLDDQFFERFLPPGARLVGLNGS